MTSRPSSSGLGDAAAGQAGRLVVFDQKPPAADLRGEVLEGLRSSPKRLSPKFFYDETGSVLFERITELPEYYLTRTEMALFDEHLGDVTDAIGEGVCLVEYGAGSNQKIRKLLERARPAAYVPVDISGDHLENQARALHRDYPWLDIYPTCADFTAPFTLPEPVAGIPHVGFFPGSSIGNFDPDGAVRFLGNVHATLGVGGRLLVGIDRKKDPAVIEAAYNDSRGVTAAFNLNALRHINQRLGADFRLDAFAHEAHYNAELGCIQMFLRSRADQTVHLGSEHVRIAAGERIHTENSFKYHPDEFQALAGRGRFAVEDWWTDPQDLFALFLLRAGH